MENSPSGNGGILLVLSDHEVAAMEKAVQDSYQPE